MHRHSLFGTIAGVLLVFALFLTYFVGWNSLPFFLFAVAAAVRGFSLRKEHAGAKYVSYVLFFLGIAATAWALR